LWDWIPEDDEKRFYSEEADTLTIGTLYWLAYKLGYGTTNAAALQPDHVIESLNELPPDGSYLLRAFTGVGKSQAQKPTIARVLAAGKRVIWLVPTKSLARDAATALGGTVYLDEEGEIKPSEELRKTPFV